MSAAALPIPRPATLQDLLALPNDGQGYEIMDGELVQKEASAEHGRAQNRLSRVLGPRFDRRSGGRWPGGWWFASEVLIAFPGLAEPLRPDVVGWRRDKVPSPPKGTCVTLIPDWICEIVSPNNRTNDTIKKKRIYHQAHVGHYWLLDPLDETLQVYRWGDAGYTEVLSATRDDRVKAEPFEVMEFKLAVFFGEDEDEDEEVR